MKTPNLYIIAGPNGAGKSTFAQRFLPTYAGCAEFVNADMIARGLSPFAPDGVQTEAGRLFLARIKALSRAGRDFGFETTLAGRATLRTISRLKADGYRVHMFYLWVPNVDLALRRISDRVKKGGHDVPAYLVRRRYERSVRNLFSGYASLADRLFVLDNGSETPRVVFRRIDNEETVIDEEVMGRLRGMSGGSVMRVKEEKPLWCNWKDMQRSPRAC